MKKTVLQQLIEFTDKHMKDSTIEQARALNGIATVINLTLLEQEKQDIINAYRDGRIDQRCDMMPEFYNRMADQYFNETFEQ